MSVPKAIELLKQIKAGELEIGGKKRVVPTRVTPEQQEIPKALEVPPIPSPL